MSKELLNEFYIYIKNRLKENIYNIEDVYDKCACEISDNFDVNEEIAYYVVIKNKDLINKTINEIDFEEFNINVDEILLKEYYLNTFKENKNLYDKKWFRLMDEIDIIHNNIKLQNILINITLEFLNNKEEYEDFNEDIEELKKINDEEREKEFMNFMKYNDKFGFFIN